METGTFEEIRRARKVHSVKPKRDILIKVRLTAAELLLLEEVMRQVKTAERALAFRRLLELFPALAEADRVVGSFRVLRDAERDFNEIMEKKAQEALKANKYPLLQ